MTTLFIVAAIPVLALGWLDPHTSPRQRPDHRLGQPRAGGGDPRLPGRDGARDRHRGPRDLDRPARPTRQPTDDRRFGRGTLAADDRHRRRVDAGADGARGPPPRRNPAARQHPDLRAGPRGDRRRSLFAFFQITSGVLLLAAAASSFQAGPGLLRRSPEQDRGARRGCLPPPLARTNQPPHPGYGGRRLRADIGSDPACGKWSGARARTRLRGGRLRQLPGRSAGDGALLAPPGARGCWRPTSSARRSWHSRSWSTSLAATRCSRWRDTCWSPGSALAVGARGPAPGDRGRGADRGSRLGTAPLSWDPAPPSPGRTRASSRARSSATPRPAAARPGGRRAASRAGR